MTPNGAKVTVLTWLKDEEHIVPFFLRHYAFADEIIAWDNGSTDRTLGILRASSKVVVNNWDSGGELRDDQLTQMKSEEYRKTGPGWKIIVDIDEFVWHQDILRFLDLCDRYGITLPMTQGFDMVSRHIPADDGVTPLTDIVREGRPNPMYSKCCVVRDTCFITFNPGAHSPKEITGRLLVSDRRHLKMLHYRYLSQALVMEKAMRIVLSDYNRRVQIGVSQASPEAMMARWEEAWRGRVMVLP